MTSHRTIACLLGVALTSIGAACGGPSAQRSDPPAATAASPAKGDATPSRPAYSDDDAPASDAFKTFSGPKVAGTQPVIIKSRAAVGFASAECVLLLKTIRWMVIDLGHGKKHREGSADFILRKGADTVPVSVTEGQTRRLRGVSITLIASGEDYDKDKLEYLPWAKVLVDKVAPAP